MAQLFKPQIASDWEWQAHGRRFTSVDLSAAVLAKLKRDAEASLKQPLDEAVVTVPAYFGEAQRRLTSEAASRAGLRVLKLLNEPTAAAIMFGITGAVQDQTILVYDLGGGTFDVTVCRVANGEVNVLASYGSTNLGGRNFDDRILEFVAHEFKTQHGFDPREDAEAAGDLYDRVVLAKHQLSTRESASVAVTANGKRMSVPITRAEFEALCRRYVGQSKLSVAEALQRASLGYADIDRVLLVGGSTRIPMIAHELGQEFGKPPETVGNPDEVVALGAALEATRLKTSNDETRTRSGLGDFIVRDILPHSLGIHAYRPGSNQPINKVILLRGAKIPCDKTYRFQTAAENVTALRVIVYQGDYERVEDCQRVGEFVLSDLPPGRAAGMPVDVTIACNENAIVEVTAVDVSTGQQARTTANYSDLHGGQDSDS